MSYIDFYNDIKNNSISSMYIFFGQEKYLIKSALAAVESSVVDSDYKDFNYTVIDADKLNAHDVIDSAETMPFLAQKKVVIARKVPYFKTQKTGLMADEEDRLINYFKNPSESTVLIFVLEDKPDKRKAIYKNFIKNGSVIEFGTLDKSTFPKWIVKTLKASGKTVEPKILNKMVEDTGYLEYGSNKRLYDVINELNQLISYLGDRQNITVEDLNAIWKKSIEKSVFDMVDALGHRNMDAAFMIFEKLIYEGEPPVKILAMIVRHYRNLFKIKIYDNQGYSPSVMASKLKLPPFILKKQLIQTKKSSENELSSKLQECLRIEYLLKTGKLEPKLSVEMLMIKLCRGA